MATPDPVARRTGFEIELLAPPGSDRRVLADELARRCGGHVKRVLASSSEPSAVPGMGSFWHLTPAFEVRGPGGELRATLVDDVTLNADLPRTGHQHPTWWRLLTDDPRLLRLVAATVDPAASRDAVLEPVAAVFGSSVEVFPAAARVRDAAGATIALAASLPAGRERPCEIVTPPLDHDHGAVLRTLLQPARQLGFSVPHEAAVHLHLDAGPFRNVAAFSDLVRLFTSWRGPLYAALRTNPGCTRLGPLPADLMTVIGQHRATTETDDDDAWARLQEAARATGPVKFCDVNLTALLQEDPPRDTVEVRVLGGSTDAGQVAADAHLVHRLLARCGNGPPITAPPPHLAELAARDGGQGAATARSALLELATGHP